MTSRGRPLLLLLLVAVTAVACGRTPAAEPAPLPTDQVGLTVIPVSERVTAPPLAGTTLSGESLDIAEFRGEPLIVNSWASWCSPCREEIPLLRQIADERPPVRIVGLDVQDRTQSARDFAQETSMTWPSIEDPQGQLLAEIPGVPPKALPSTIAIDPQGRIAARVIGPIKPDMVKPLVAAARTGD